VLRHALGAQIRSCHAIGVTLDDAEWTTKR